MKTDDRRGLLHRLPDQRELTRLVPAIPVIDNSAKEEDSGSGNGSTLEIGTARAGDFMRRFCSHLAIGREETAQRHLSHYRNCRRHYQESLQGSSSPRCQVNPYFLRSRRRSAQARHSLTEFAKMVNEFLKRYGKKTLGVDLPRRQLQ